MHEKCAIVWRIAIRRAKHAVYDLKYHLVGVLKYRKNILTKEVKQRAEELLPDEDCRSVEEYQLEGSL